MTNILVTGGAGYIGSHTCKALALAGYTPITYDNLVYGHEWAVKWGPLEKGDVLDASRLDDVIKAYEPAAVIHFAAFAYVGESVENPAKYYNNNVVGTLSLLDAMRRHGLDKIVFSSTCATYGIPGLTPINENTPQQPINSYGASKLMIERILADYGLAYGVKSVALRYFNAAGADPDGEIGEAHDPETHLILLVLDVAAGRRPHIIVFSSDYETPDGTCVRDYIHVRDLADAHVFAMRALGKRDLLPAYNLGTDVGHSVSDTIVASEKVSGRKILTKVAPRRTGDPVTLVADASKAMNDLRWTPYFTDINATIASAWRCHQGRNANGVSNLAVTP